MVDVDEASVDSTVPPQDAPPTSDTVQTEGMKKAGIIVNTALGIVICLGCRSVVRPLNLYTHITKGHSLPVTRTFCQSLTRDYELQKEPTRPGKIVNAIFGLDIVHDYWSCGNCGAAFQTQGSAGRHGRDNPSCLFASHTKQPAQSYFPTSGRTHFGVTIPAPPSDPSPNPVTIIKSSYNPTPFRAIPIQVVGFRDANHFLSIEKWAVYVEGMTGEQIWYICRESEPELRELVKGVVAKYAKEAVEDLGSAENSIKVAIGDFNG